MEKKIMVLASGRGSDFQAIADHRNMGILSNVKLRALVCNHRDAPVLERARASGVESFFIEGVAGRIFATQKEREESRLAFDKQCVEKVQQLGIDLVVLAGFDQIITKYFVDSCKFKILNIHPAYDLKKFGGKNMVGRRVHEVALASGARYSGCTIHYVTNDLDLGPAVLKRRTKILPGDTPESLEKRILQLEHMAYPEAIQLVLDDRVLVDEQNNRCYIDRYSDGWDIEWEARQQKYIEHNRDSN